MKKVTVKLNAELEIPDNWMVEKDANGEDVIKIDDKVCTFDIISTWFDQIEDEELEGEMDELVYDAVKTVSCEIKEA